MGCNLVQLQGGKCSCQGHFFPIGHCVGLGFVELNVPIKAILVSGSVFVLGTHWLLVEFFLFGVKKFGFRMYAD